MCKALQEAKKMVNMTKGERYGIGTALGGLAAFSVYGMLATECVACAQTGAALTLMNLPEDTQKKFGIGAREVVTFNQTGHNTQDEIVLHDGRHVLLSEFANKGVGVYAGEIEEIDTDEIGDGGTVLTLPNSTRSSVGREIVRT